MTVNDLMRKLKVWKDAFGGDCEIIAGGEMSKYDDNSAYMGEITVDFEIIGAVIENGRGVLLLQELEGENI